MTRTRFIRARELTRIVGLNRKTIDRLESAGRFPKKVKLGPRAVAWLEHDVVAWIARVGKRKPENLELRA